MTLRFLTVLLLLQGCGAPASLSDLHDQTLPSRWSTIQNLGATGLYADIGSKTLAPEIREYRPAFELYSDGLIKARFVSLPAGATIDSSNMDAWKFPNGTRLWKEFAKRDADDALVRVETRLLEKSDDGAWIYATYRWNADQTEAVLASRDGEYDVAEVAPGITHDLPPMTDCQYCHENGNATVLGFSAFQLGEESAEHERGEHEVSLESLTAAQTLTHTPTQDMTIHAATPLEREVVGYLHANCSHCHNPSAQGIGVALNYAYSPTTITQRSELPILRDIGRTVDTPGIYIPGVFTFDQKLIDLENPSHSMMLYRIEGAESPDRMPRLGTKIRDQAFIAKLKAWFAEL